MAIPLVARSLLPDHLCKIVDLLLGDCFSVGDVQAIQVNDLLGIILLIHLIKDLPSCVEVYLLHHFLELLVAYLFWPVF